MKSLNSLVLKDLPYLNGTLPTCLGDISTLGSIKIEQTGIQGEIPWSRWIRLFVDRGNINIATSWGHGFNFFLSGNLGLYGRALPEEFPLMDCQIDYLMIESQPDLSGNLSSTIARCSIKRLVITDVSLTGDLPLEICEICSLKRLIITGTNLSKKSIDTFKSKCSKTQHIDLCISKGKGKELPYGNEPKKYNWQVS